MDPRKPTLPGMRTRVEWVKMFYPDMPQGIPVGVIHQWGPSIWVLYRRTDDTAFNAERNSPMGLDVGTLRYLSALEHPPLFVDFYAEGARELLRCPLWHFDGYPPQQTLTSKNAARHRIFVPLGHWTPMALYNEVRPPYWDVTHLQEDGSVIARYVSRGRP